MRFPLEQVSGSMMNEAADWANYSDLKLEPNRLWGSDILWLCRRRMWVHSPSEPARSLVGVGCAGLREGTRCAYIRAHVPKLVHAWFVRSRRVGSSGREKRNTLNLNQISMQAN